MVALSFTATSKETITGMPTPTDSPFSGATDGYVCWSRLRSTVRKLDRLVTSAPSERRATVVTAYAVPGSSSPPATQVTLSPDSLPGTGPDGEVTLTLRRVPPSASRVSRVSTGTSRGARA